MKPEAPARVRLAGEEELALVHRLMLESFEEYRGHPHPSSALEETLEDVRRVAGRGGAILAWVGDRAVGSGRFEWRTRSDGRRALFYERLAVRPADRGRGIGEAMIRWLEAHARRNGAAVVEVTVRSQQPDNRPYYLARGYRITGYSGRYGIEDLRTHMEKDVAT